MLTMSENSMSSTQLAMVVKVARMYHEEGLSQPAIAEHFRVSQSRVSRWLKEAVRIGVVRTIVVAPEGLLTSLEDSVRTKYGLKDVVVAEVASTSSDAAMLSSIGSVAAAYLEVTLTGNNRVGLSSWSSTLLATAHAMTRRNVKTAHSIIQVIGGVGNPAVQVRATQLAEQFARVTGADPRFLPAPGIVASKEGRDVLMSDPFVAQIAEEWKTLDTLLVGIGTIQPSPLLKDSGNSLPETSLQHLAAAGAVGDVCLRFFDVDGKLVPSEIDDRVLGIGVDELQAVDRRIGVAGGAAKYEAIRAAVLGGWVDVLITDRITAERLAVDQTHTK
jgi:DNA-binding transcriptional regulator LsrR (DeoR family)